MSIIFTDYISPKHLLLYISGGVPMIMGVITSSDVSYIANSAIQFDIHAEIQIMNLSIGKWIQKKFIHRPVTCSMDYDVTSGDVIVMVVPQYKIGSHEPIPKLEAMSQNDEIRYIYLCQQSNFLPLSLQIKAIDTTEERVETMFDEPRYDQTLNINAAN